MFRSLKNLRRKAAQRGQGMTEYIIIIAVVAILSLAVIIKFGDNIRQMFFTSGSEMTGNDETLDNHMDNGDVEKGLNDI